MRLSSRSILLLLAFVAASLPAQQSPGHTGGSRLGIDVLHYEFRLDFPDRPFPDEIRFVATTRARRMASVPALALDLSAALHVDSVLVNSRAAEFTRPGDSVRVALPPGSNDTISVAVFYRGLPTDGLILQREGATGFTAFGDNFPDRARQWLATVDHPSDKALVDWVVRTPLGYRVIANGELVEESPEAGTTASRATRTHWRTTRPIYTAVMVIGVAPFAVLELGPTACNLAERAGCVHQSVWTSAEKRAFMPGSFARAGDIVSFFSSLVAPFPYEKLAHVASSTRYGGMENAAAIFYAENLFRQDAPSEGLIAHETAHQWFGDAVTEREWAHVWLSEGFATYFAALWTEHAHGDSAFRSDMSRMRSRAIASPIILEKAVVDTTLDDLERVLNTNVYEKAGFVLHMLRREIGDSAFFRGIRSYYVAHRHGNVMTSDLQAAFERAAGRPLDWFFAQWMHRPGYAELGVSWTYDAVAHRLRATITQGNRVAPYRLSLAVDVTDAQGTTKRVRVAVPAQASSTITIPVTLNARPRTVDFDADISLLGTVKGR